MSVFVPVTAARRSMLLGTVLGMVSVLFVGPGQAAARPPATSYQRAVITVEGSETFIASTSGNPINRRGMVAGVVRVDGFDRAAVLDTVRNRMDILPTLGGQTSEARDINSAGYVVGSAETVSAERHPFLWVPATREMIDLGTLGGNFGMALALNDAGVVVGSTMNADGVTHAFRWLPGSRQMFDLGTLGGRSSEAAGINRRGYIVGIADDVENGPRAFLWSPRTNTMKDLGVVAGRNLSRATDINDHQVVVGESFSAADNSTVPFVWKKRFPGPRALAGVYGFGFAAGISADGTIVGTVNPAEGFTPRAVVWRHNGRQAIDLPASSTNSGAVAINRHNRIFGKDGDELIVWSCSRHR